VFFTVTRFVRIGMTAKIQPKKFPVAIPRIHGG